MDKNQSPADLVYYWNPLIRILSCLLWSLLATFGLFGLVAGIVHQISHPPESGLSLVGMFFLLGFLTVSDLFLVLTAVSSARAGRLVFCGERALLPRIPLGPGGLLPRELYYSQIERFGFVIQQGHGLIAMDNFVLLFEVRVAGLAPRTKLLRLALVWHTESAAILEEFIARTGITPEQLEHNWLGDVRFTRSERPRLPSPSPERPSREGRTGVYAKQTERESCYLCGKPLRSDEMASRVCQACLA